MVKGKKFESDFKSPLHRGKEKQQVELLLQFLESSKNYCVCVVDMVGSTSIAMGMSNEKIGMYYGAFLNMMAEIASSFGATVVKNIGDSLLYYFPKTDSDSNEPFKDVLKCSMVMIQKRPEINARMHIDGLPDISYRIFGNSVNLCSKINLLASPNSIVIGKGLYQKTKSFNEYVFTKLKDTGLSLGRDYQVYSVSNKN